MKTSIRTLLFVLGLGFLAASCSMQKRQYLPGYHITWKHAKHQSEQQQVAFKQDAPAATTESLSSGKALEAQEPAKSNQRENAEAPVLAANGEPSHADAKPVYTRPATPSKTTALSIASVKKNPVINIAIRKMKAVASDGDTRVNGFAIASMVCGIVALFAYYGAFVLGVLAVVFAAIALNKIKTSGERGRMMAIAGLICGIVAIAIVATIVTVAAL